MMERLFDFIFGNLPFLVIVIGGIISLLKRANTNNEKKPARKSKPFIPRPKDSVKELPQTDMTQPTAIYSSKEIDYMNKFQEVDIQPNPFYENEIQGIAQPIKETNSSLQKHNINLNVKEINKKKVVEGIIWGEVLGPPRAKKKYSHSYTKRV